MLLTKEAPHRNAEKGEVTNEVIRDHDDLFLENEKTVLLKCTLHTSHFRLRQI